MAEHFMTFVDAEFAYIPGSNTFRMGDKWAKLRPGDTVRAMDKDNKLMGSLTVASIVITDLAMALLHHAGQNHGVMQDAVRGFADVHLREILQKAYPDLDLQDDSLTTVVVYFRSH
jgi:hypothetical protein